MSSRLLEVLEDTVSKRTNLGLSLQVLYNRKDWTIENAALAYSDVDSEASLTMTVGLRSRILSLFPRFATESGSLCPCDIPALVPVVVLIANRPHGLSEGRLVRMDSTSVELEFVGTKTEKSSSLKILAIAVDHFMTCWEQWVQILLGTLARDPQVGSWKIDWYELLAGESGFVTMPWFPEVPLTDRALALDRMVTASRALLNSVLKKRFDRHELVEELVNWLEGLKPLPQVLRAEVFAEQEVV